MRFNVKPIIATALLSASLLVGVPALAGPNVSIGVVDSTPTTPAVAGQLVLFSGSTWALNTVAGQSSALGQYGVIAKVAAAQGGNAYLQTNGTAAALCATGSVAIAAGNSLVADGAGNFTVPAPSATPSSGTATPKGTTGATTYTYDVYARNAYSLDSAISADITTSTGNAALTPGNSIQISVTVPAGTKEIIVVRKTGGAAQGVIGRTLVATGNTVADFLDIGYTAGAATYTVNTTPAFAAGQVLGIALGTLAASTSSTACSVALGGF